MTVEIACRAMIDVDAFKRFIVDRSEPVNDCFVVDARCIRGDTRNVLHGGKRARKPREGKLFSRIIAMVNSWMVHEASWRVPTVKELAGFVKEEVDDRGALDAMYVDKRCFRGDPMARGRSRYPREKALLRQVLSLARDFRSWMDIARK